MPTESTPTSGRSGSSDTLADRRVPLEEISWCVGRFGTAVTEEAYRKQLRTVIQTGLAVMDGICKRDPER
nr:hypothetical protein [Streptomyces harenosi]